MISLFEWYLVAEEVSVDCLSCVEPTEAAIVALSLCPVLPYHTPSSVTSLTPDTLPPRRKIAFARASYFAKARLKIRAKVLSPTASNNVTFLRILASS